MMRQTDQLQALIQVAHQCGVSTDLLHEWLQENLIPLRNNEWDDEAIETVKRIRRLTALGVNTAGVEIVLYMREQILRTQQEHEALRSRYEREISRLMRQLSIDF